MAAFPGSLCTRPLLLPLRPAVPQILSSSRLPAGLQFFIPAAHCYQCMKPRIMPALKQPKPNLAGNEKLSCALLKLRACPTARRLKSEALVVFGPVLAISRCLTALSGGRCSCRIPRNLASAVPLSCWHCDGNDSQPSCLEPQEQHLRAPQRQV
jgi:hypothetical protein